MGGFLQNVYELGTGCFHFIRCFINHGSEYIVTDICQQTNNQTGTRCDHLHINPPCNIIQRKLTRAGNTIKQLNHSYNGSQKPKHGGNTGD